MLEKQLSIIIPFLNEKDEVENTIKSALEYSKGDIELIVINDASDDGYDYQMLSNKYPIRYIENIERLGVAASRDLGVSLSTTPYFLLLDAHMRFYDTNWVSTIISILEDNPKYLLCCQSKVLSKNNNGLVYEEMRSECFGAYVELSDPSYCFSPKWIEERKDINNDDQILDIPCVLGAGYACSKKYWQYLRGLEGLLYYGYDETYISIKVWLSGGKCKLLRNVIIGHIYRDSFPYQTDNYYPWYNRLLLNFLLVPRKQQKIFLSKMRIGDPFAKAYRLFLKNEEKINELGDYYGTILTEKLSFFNKLNEVFVPKVIKNENEFIKEIASFLLLRCQTIEDIGLLHGRMGIVIFLYHYSRYIGCKVYEELANDLLDTICSSLNLNMSYFLQSGLIGIGWGIEYLYQNAFIDGDIDDILEVIDDKIKEIDITRIKDLSINNGLGGIANYIIARLYNKDISSQSTFNQEYLYALYKRLIEIVNGEDITDAIDIFVKYINLYEGRIKQNIPLSIYDITFLRIPEDYELNKSLLGIRDGSSGVGLMLISKHSKI